MTRQILIVDDSPEDREAVSTALRRHPRIRHEITEADCGALGLRLLRENPTQFDLLVLDYRLPDMNAAQFLERFLGQNRVPPVPVVMLTGSLAEDIPGDSHLQLGVQDYFSKSEISPELLTRITANAIERHKLLRRLDSSERMAKEAQAAAEEARVNAESANRAKSQFLTMISHELRTPLTAILGFTDLLKNDPNVHDATEMLTMMSSSGAVLAELLDDLIDMAKVEANTLDVEIVSCSPVNIIEDTCELLSIRADEKGLKLEQRAISDLPETFYTDPTRFRQIIVNLISNAIKFTKAGSVVCEWEGSSDGKHVSVYVRDTGPGISDDVRDNVFTPFVQGASLGEHREGIGLGLAISKRLANMLGGDLTIESTSGSGTTFRFDSRSRSEQANHVSHKPENEAIDSQPPNLAGMRILVAEDMRANQFLIGKLLEPTGAEVGYASNGKEAVSAAIDGGNFPSPDLIIMDMLMPKMNGFEATQELRRVRFEGPIIALTAVTAGHDHAKCLSSGCDEVITKPIDVAQLYHSLRRKLID